MDSLTHDKNRNTNEPLEALIGVRHSILDKGHVTLIDYLGTDLRIVDAARVCYGSGTKKLRSDEQLIGYLVRMRHNTPLEQCSMTFRIKMPIFVARQWVRHRTAKMNEISGEYSVFEEEFYVPDIRAIRMQHPSLKQSYSDSPVPQEIAERFLELEHKINHAAYIAYKEMADSGITRGLARIFLPVSLYTEVFWQMDLHNLFHFLSLRTPPEIQMEIRAYALKIAEITKTGFPIAYSAWEKALISGKENTL